jgi:signal transduction histidine kinase
MNWSFRVLLAGILSLAALGTASAEPRRVLLLHSFGPQFVPWTYFSGQFREALIKQSPNAIDLYEASLESARFAKLDEQGPVIEYLRSLFAERKLDLIVTMGAPAARFVQRYRSQFFPSTPLIMGAVEQRVISGAALTANATAVPVALDLPMFIEHILHVLPDTTHVAWAIGASPLEKFWVDELRRASQPFTNRVTFEWFNELSFEDMLRRIGTLPPHSAVFFGDIRMDAAGVPLDHERALARLREATSAPIFGFVDSYLGQGIVGGPLLSTEELGRRMAAVAVRILSGEAPETIKTPPVGLGAPVYDWRELTHWKISEARLPPGSIVRFGELTVWERYRWLLIGGSTLVSLQGAMITWLLLERRSRLRAEVESRRRSLEVMHLSRTAEAGALSASFAHELSQPLTAIMLSAEEAGRLLEAEPPNVSRAKEILGHICQVDQHATEIISHVKKLLKRRSEVEAHEFDLNEAIADAIQILSPEVKKREVTLLAMGSQEPLPVRADSIHLQQVILNLARNGMDAMTKAAAGAHTITIQTALLAESTVEVSVSDSGAGIPEHKLSEIFDTFYTTKEHGIGLGLSIARTIVETYGGKIWAENHTIGGAVIRFTLPLIRQSA